MLDLLSYPVSWLLRFWHDLTATLADASGVGWVVAIVALVITLRLVLLRPAVAQARGAARMRALQPQLAKLRKRHGHDPTRFAAETRRLYAEHGVSPAAGCAPMLVQMPVLIGLSHLVYSLGRTPSGHGRFVLDATDVHSFESAQLAGGRIISGLLEFGSGSPHIAAGVTIVSAVVSFTLIVVTAVGSHLNARLALRNAPAPTEFLARWTRYLTLWAMPAGALVAGPFLATGILVYWTTNTLCTLGQTALLSRRVMRPARV